MRPEAFRTLWKGKVAMYYRYVLWMSLKRNHDVVKHVLDGVYEARSVSNSLEGKVAMYYRYRYKYVLWMSLKRNYDVVEHVVEGDRDAGIVF
jgi:hypothetical protein